MWQWLPSQSHKHPKVPLSSQLYMFLLLDTFSRSHLRCLRVRPCWLAGTETDTSYPGQRPILSPPPGSPLSTTCLSWPISHASSLASSSLRASKGSTFATRSWAYPSLVPPLMVSAFSWLPGPRKVCLPMGVIFLTMFATEGLGQLGPSAGPRCPSAEGHT